MAVIGLPLHCYSLGQEGGIRVRGFRWQNLKMETVGGKPNNFVNVIT